MKRFLLPLALLLALGRAEAAGVIVRGRATLEGTAFQGVPNIGVIVSFTYRAGGQNHAVTAYAETDQNGDFAAVFAADGAQAGAATVDANGLYGWSTVIEGTGSGKVDANGVLEIDASNVVVVND